MADGGAVVDFDTEVFDFLDFSAYHFFRETVFWDAKHEDTTRLYAHLEDFDVDPLAGEVAGDGQSGGT